MMTTIELHSARPKIKNVALLIALCVAPFLLVYLSQQAQTLNPTMGLLDAGIWQLIALSILCFLGLSALSWWLLQRAWVNLGLPKMIAMVSHFNTLTTCQQLAFYWASFALLLFAAVLSLVAVL